MRSFLIGCLCGATIGWILGAPLWPTLLLLPPCAAFGVWLANRYS